MHKILFKILIGNVVSIAAISATQPDCIGNNCTSMPHSRSVLSPQTANRVIVLERTLPTLETRLDNARKTLQAFQERIANEKEEIEREAINALPTHKKSRLEYLELAISGKAAHKFDQLLIQLLIKTLS
jgi:uncharacterized protein (DUF342 family)